MAVAAHLAFDALIAGGASDGKGDIGNATLALYLAASFGAQQMVMLKRAERAETDLRTAAGPASVNRPLPKFRADLMSGMSRSVWRKLGALALGLVLAYMNRMRGSRSWA